MKYLIWFLIGFTIIYLFYFITVVLQVKKYEKFRNSNQVMFFVKRYNLDPKKINIKKFINIISINNSFIIALSFSLTTVTNNFIYILLIGLSSIIPLILITYHFIGIYLKKENLK